ncbi:MAG: thiamine pyrophosphate-dependent enzyme, partial [Verrucomicrobiota bacterium]
MVKTAHLSDMRPDSKPFIIDCGKIPAFQYTGNLKKELAAETITKQEAINLLEDMLVIREFEEMIVKLRSGAYTPLPTYNYRGPTHVSIGQEGCAAGACTLLTLNDKITSTHRGHGESLAKGTVAIRAMSVEQLKARVPWSKATKHEQLVEDALEEHLYKTIGELFGKDDGYCKGRGGSMHIADFTVGHLGANAIVGGGTPIATGAAMGLRYLHDEAVVTCFA